MDDAPSDPDLEGLHEPERRNQPRAPVELRVEYKRLNSFFADYTRNISRGGTFIRTPKPLPVGTEFVFSLIVPGLAEPLSVRGRVQWIVEPGGPSGNDPGMGIQFRYEAEEERRTIESTVERLMVESLGPALFHRLLSRSSRPPPPGGKDG